MFHTRGMKIGSLMTALGLSFAGCQEQNPQPLKEPASGIVNIPGWNASVRLYEVTDGKWAMAVAGGQGVAIHEASPPKSEGAAVKFGNMVHLPGWNVSLIMAKMQNDQWYVIAAGGMGVAVTEARGQYSGERTPFISEVKPLEGWNTSSRTVTMQDGYNYVVLAGGTGVDIRPLDRHGSFESSPGR